MNLSGINFVNKCKNIAFKATQTDKTKNPSLPVDEFVRSKSKFNFKTKIIDNLTHENYRKHNEELAEKHKKEKKNILKIILLSEKNLMKKHLS